MAKNKKISRRKFLVRGSLGTVGVLAVGTYLFRNPMRRALLEKVNAMDMSYMGEGVEPTIWFEITKENMIILHSPKVEMGQGTFTGLAQMAADELEVSMERLQVVHASSASGNIDLFSTGGSTSIVGLWQPLRELAATMREMLKMEGAKQLGTSLNEVSVVDGTVSDASSSLTYAVIAEKTSEWHLPETPSLKDVRDYRYIGRPIPRVDLEDKVFGAPIFGIDVALPNLVYGAVVRPTKIGASLQSADIAIAETMDGVVQIVQGSDFIGVVAETFTQAERAKQAIKTTWVTERDWQSKDIIEMTKVGMGNAFLLQKKGDAIDDGADVIQMEFQTPIGAHAQLEPNGVVADVSEKGATIYISTQVVALTRKEVANALGFSEDQVTIKPTYLGGGFGRRLHTPHAVQAALMSKEVGRPVKYFFSRQEEFQHDMFRPPTHHLLKGVLDDQGNIESIEHDLSSGSVAIGSPLLPSFINTVIGTDVGAIRGAFCQYLDIPNIRTVSWHVELPFATSWWRSLGLLANTFAWESFMDGLAVRAGKDPIGFRLNHIADDEAGRRLKSVIRKAGDVSNYSDEVKGGKAMGFAASTDAGTPCAHVVEVSLIEGRIKVHRVICVLDPGLAVNPDQVRAQCEGSIMMGLSASIYEKMEVVDGELSPIIYGPYQMATLKDTPKEITVILLQGRDSPGPVGEPPLGPIGAAIANAIFRLTGKRLTRMPLQEELKRV